MDELSEDQLLQLSQEGNVEAFAALAFRYHERIYNTVLGLTKNHLDADDLSQETFMRAFKSLKGFKRDSSFYTWLYKIALNLTINFVKKSERRRKKSDVLLHGCEQTMNPSRAVPSPEDFALKLELRERVRQAMNELPIVYRAKYVLFAQDFYRELRDKLDEARRFQQRLREMNKRK